MIFALVGVNTQCRHWVLTPTKRGTALVVVNTYQGRYCFVRCQHLVILRCLHLASTPCIAKVLNRLSKVQGKTITEEAILEVPGFSEFVLSQIKSRIDYPPRKTKADESGPSEPSKKRQPGRIL